MVAIDQLLSWTILFEVCYVTADALTHFSRRTLEETARRIVVVFVLSLLGSSMLQVFYEQVSQEVLTFRGPVLSAVWIVSLLIVFGCSWSFYHWMLHHSGRIQSERIGIVELVEKQTTETLNPMQERFVKMEGAAIAQRTSLEQWGTKVTGAMDAMQTASESTKQSVQSLHEWIDVSKRDMKRVMDRYDQWAKAHRNDAATIYLVS